MSTMNDARLWKMASYFGTKAMMRKSFLVWLSVLIVGNIGSTLFAFGNHGHGILDFAGHANLLSIKTLWLTDGESYAHLKSYTEFGLKLYFYILMIDFLVPIAGSFFFVCSFSFFYLNQRISNSVYVLFCALSVLFILSDYAENIFILLMLSQLPDTIPMYSYFATLSLTLKFGISLASCATIAVLYVARASSR